MGSSWGTPEIHVEKVTEQAFRSQSLEELKRESDKAINTIKAAVSDIDRTQSCNIAEYVVECQNAINEIRYSIEPMMLSMNHATGFDIVSKSLYRILYHNYSRTSERGFLDAAEECRRIVNEYCETIAAFDTNANYLMLIDALQYVIGQGKINSEDVFDVFCKSIVYVCNKLADKLKSQYGVDYSKDIFSAVGHKMAAVYGEKAGSYNQWHNYVYSMASKLSKPDDKIFEDLLRKINAL